MAALIASTASSKASSRCGRASFAVSSSLAASSSSMVFWASSRMRSTLSAYSRITTRPACQRLAMACFLPTSGLALFNSLDFAVSAPARLSSSAARSSRLLATSPAC